MEDVKSVCGVKYLCTRKLNQYPLENCFSFIRAKGGFSANPDPKQFADAYKQVLIKSCISQPEFSNCESDNNLLLLEVFGTHSKQCANDTAVIATDDALGITCSHRRQFATPTKCFVLCWRVYLQEISCETQLQRVYFVIDMLWTEWFVWLLYYVFAAEILQQRIFWEIRSHHP